MHRNHKRNINPNTNTTMTKTTKHIGDLEIVRHRGMFYIYRVNNISERGYSSEPTGASAYTYSDVCKLINRMRAEENH